MEKVVEGKEALDLKMTNEIEEVHEILEKYIAIHDAVFKRSWRKAIPLPGLFKPIKYGQHAAALNSLVSAIDRVAVGLGVKVGVPDILSRYIAALTDAMKTLCDMCTRLYGMSEGDTQGYTLGLHKEKVAEYEGLVERYYALGAELNRYLEQ